MDWEKFIKSPGVPIVFNYLQEITMKNFCLFTRIFDRLDGRCGILRNFGHFEGEYLMGFTNCGIPCKIQEFWNFL
jgi:hypothetical protein